MKRLIIIPLCFFALILQAQQEADVHMMKLQEKYSREINMSCEVRVKVEVDGMVVPEKKLRVEFRGAEKPKIDGKGLSLIPKRGTMEQFREMLTAPRHDLFLSRRGKNLVYKLVSLDPKSDWITADLEFDPEEYLIHSAVVQTRDLGSVTTLNEYHNGDFPSKTVIFFEARNFRLPLKFIGGEQSRVNPDSKKTARDKNESIQGKVTLWYTYL